MTRNVREMETGETGESATIGEATLNYCMVLFSLSSHLLSNLQCFQKEVTHSLACGIKDSKL